MVVITVLPSQGDNRKAGSAIPRTMEGCHCFQELKPTTVKVVLTAATNIRHAVGKREPPESTVTGSKETVIDELTVTVVSDSLAEKRHIL